MLVLTFFSLILSYLSFLVFPYNPYHGKDPLRKYTNMSPIDSKSSLLDYSMPKWVLTEAYLAVPVKDLLSL